MFQLDIEKINWFSKTTLSTRLSSLSEIVFELTNPVNNNGQGLSFISVVYTKPLGHDIDEGWAGQSANHSRHYFS